MSTVNISMPRPSSPHLVTAANGPAGVFRASVIDVPYVTKSIISVQWSVSDTFLSAALSRLSKPSPRLALMLALDPIPLHRPLEVLVASDRQVSLLELLLDDLPPAQRNLLIDRGDAARRNVDVGKLEQAALLDDCLGHLCRLWRLVNGLDELSDGVDLRQLGVVDVVARQLEDALVELR